MRSPRRIVHRPSRLLAAVLLAGTLLGVSGVLAPGWAAAAPPAYSARLAATLDLPTSDCGVWTELVPPGPLPEARTTAAVVNDLPRHRMIVFGGQNNSGGLNDLWSFALSGPPAWTHLVPAGTSPLRVGEMAYAVDTARDRLIVFGGLDDVLYEMHNDVWALTLTGAPTWTQLAPTGTAPPPRRQACAIYDPTRDRIVVFGGYNEESIAFNDVWALSLSGSGAWTQLTPSGTPPADPFLPAAVYDAPRDRMVIVTGYGGLPAETWQLSFAGGGAWSPIAVGTTPTSYQPHVIVDPVRDRVVMSGDGVMFALALSGSQAWSRIGETPAPLGHYEMMTIYDTDHDRLVSFSGRNTLYEYVNDVWALSFPTNLYTLNASCDPAAAGTVTKSPNPACYAPGAMVTLTLTPTSGYTFTGWSGDASGSSNPLTVTMNGDKNIVAHLAPEPAVCNGWSLLLENQENSPIYFTAAVFDPVDNRMLALGVNGGWQLYGMELDEGPSDWTLVPTSGAQPPPKAYPALLYDSLRHRLLLYGGSNGGGLAYDDVWALTLNGTPTWSQIVPNGGPSGARFGPAAVYDPLRDQLVVFGGSTAPNSGFRNDVWSLSLSGTPAWSPVTPIHAPPPPRSEAHMIYDAYLDRIVVYGGYDGIGGAGNFALATVYELRFGPGEWNEILTTGGLGPSVGTTYSSIYDDTRHRIVFFGSTAPDTTGRVYALKLSLTGSPSAWSVIPTANPSARVRTAPTIYDAYNDRMVVTGGIFFIGGQQSYRLDTRALSFHGPSGIITRALGVPNAIVTRTPDGCLQDGDLVALSALAPPGASFDHWEGDIAAGSPASTTVTVNGLMRIDAIFTTPPVATVLERFEAAPVARGVEVRWRFAAPDEVTGVTVERATAAAGPWTTPNVTLRTGETGVVALDATVEVGHDYWYRLDVRFRDGTSTSFGPVAAVAAGAVATTELAIAGANPGAAPVRFDLAVGTPGRVRLRVFDVAGRQVATLADDDRPAGRFSAMWNGRDGSGVVRPGIYVVRFSAADRTVTKRIALLR